MSAATVINEFAIPSTASQPISGTHAPDGNFWFTTLLLSASSTPVPDIVALGATATKDGIVHLIGGIGAFAIATSNVGSAGSITFSADTGGVNVPVTLSVCETSPSTGACLALPTPTVTTTIGAGQTPTFAVFASSTTAIPLDAKTVDSGACPAGRPAWR